LTELLVGYKLSAVPVAQPKVAFVFHEALFERMIEWDLEPEIC